MLRNPAIAASFTDSAFEITFWRASSSNSDRLSAGSGRLRQVAIGNDVMADVEHGLNRQLQVPFGVPVDERVVHEVALVGQPVNLP